MEDEVVIGLDPHKASNTIAVMDRAETLLVRRRFVNNDDGIVEMVSALGEYRCRVWAVEGANGIGRAIAQRLVAFGETVFDVPAKLATRVRVYSTGHGNKTDDTDAVAIARAAIHSRHLRVVQAEWGERGDEVAVGSPRRDSWRLAPRPCVACIGCYRELIAGGARDQLTAEQRVWSCSPPSKSMMSPGRCESRSTRSSTSTTSPGWTARSTTARCGSSRR